MLEAELSYGLTQNLKLAVSGPVVFQPDPLSTLLGNNEHANQRRFQWAGLVAIP